MIKKPKNNARLTVPLILSIAGTIVFNFSPIVFGSGMTMNFIFLGYAGIMFILSFADRRALGYATVLTACNPGNYEANLSYSFLLAMLTLIKEAPIAGPVIRELRKNSWWVHLLYAFLLIGLSIPMWPLDLRLWVAEIKQALSRLGYLVAFPVAIALTIRTQRDGIRAVSLLSLLSIAFIFIFYFWGQPGKLLSSTNIQVGIYDQGQHIFYSIGNVSMNLLRTQVCILIATIGAVLCALGVAGGFCRVAFFYTVSCACIYMISLLASTASFLAMIFGIVVVILGYFRNRLSLGSIVLGLFASSLLGSAFYWIIFHSQSMLSKRLALKMHAGQIDRMVLWKEAIKHTMINPLGEGWLSKTVVGHSDFLLNLLAYGWLTGLFYIAATCSLFFWMWRALQRHRDVLDLQSRVLLLAGLAALSVYCVNAVFDMLSANIEYFQIVWALILTPVVVTAVTEATERAPAGKTEPTSIETAGPLMAAISNGFPYGMHLFERGGSDC